MHTNSNCYHLIEQNVLGNIFLGTVALFKIGGMIYLLKIILSN